MQKQHLETTPKNTSQPTLPFYNKNSSNSLHIRETAKKQIIKNIPCGNILTDSVSRPSKEDFRRYMECPEPQKRSSVRPVASQLPSYVSPLVHRPRLNLNWNVTAGDKSQNIAGSDAKEINEPISSIFALGMPKSRTTITNLGISPIDVMHKPASISRIGHSLGNEKYIGIPPRLDQVNQLSNTNLGGGQTPGLKMPIFGRNKTSETRLPSFYNLNKINNPTSNNFGYNKSQTFLNSLILDDMEEKPNQSFMDLRQIKTTQAGGLNGYFPPSKSQIEHEKNFFNLNWGGVNHDQPKYTMGFGSHLMVDSSMKKLPSIHNLDNLSQTGFRPPKKLQREKPKQHVSNFKAIDYNGLYKPQTTPGIKKHMKSTALTFENKMKNKPKVTHGNEKVGSFTISRSSIGNLASVGMLQKRANPIQMGSHEFTKRKRVQLEPIVFQQKPPSIEMNNKVEVNCTGFEVIPKIITPKAIKNPKLDTMRSSINRVPSIATLPPTHENVIQNPIDNVLKIPRVSKKTKSSTSLDSNFFISQIF